jgi:hypothetical protein
MKNTNPILLVVTLLCLAALFSGCTSNTSSNHSEQASMSGTWVGSILMPTAGGRTNSSLSEIRFINDQAVLTMTSDRGSFSMNYTYQMNGNTLMFEPSFSPGGMVPGGRNRFNGTQPWNGSQPSTNGSWPGNNTYPPNWNGTHPPFNGTRSNNGTWDPEMTRQSTSLSFVCSFNEAQTVMYLNGAPFTRVQ